MPTDTPDVTSKIDEAIEKQIDSSVSAAIDDVVLKRIRDSVKARIEKEITAKVDSKFFLRGKESKVYDFEQLFEDRILFGARWILAPSYFILILVLVALCYKTGEEFVQFIRDFKLFQENLAIVQSLVIVDLVLVMNLVLMIMFVGYINFVSKIHPSRGEDWPVWTRHLDYSGLKLQLLGSITAISAIVLLRQIFNLSEPGSDIDSTRITLMVVIHLTFVISALIIAWVNRLKTDARDDPAPDDAT